MKNFCFAEWIEEYCVPPYNTLFNAVHQMDPFSTAVRLYPLHCLQSVILLREGTLISYTAPLSLSDSSI